MCGFHSTGKTKLPPVLKDERRYLAQLKERKANAPARRPMKVSLFPYQFAAQLFAARRGRGVLADDMGFGKTIQAILALRLLRRRRGIERFCGTLRFG